MIATVPSATLFGIDGRRVDVEVHVSSGLPSFTVVGLPDAAGRESRERIRAACASCDIAFPLQRLTVNLAPASIRKPGAGLELAIALGILGAAGDLPAGALDGTGVLGELGLDGSVRPVTGTLALVDALARAGIAEVVVPAANAAEAALVTGVVVRVARTLGELRDCVKGETPWPEPPPTAEPGASPDEPADLDDPLDLAEVRGLPRARLALAAAAAGGHHLLLVGPPGAGKTMLARRLPTVLPPLAPGDALEVTRIHSAAGIPTGGRLVTTPPFRSPHHSASTAALVGGGSPRPRPGEITLAHHGTLFLDELAEFAPRTLDALRQPLEERIVHISRQAVTLELPASFLLVACANPCPCGRPEAACRCSDAQRARYRQRISAPLLDRFDLRLYVRPPDPGAPPGPDSATVGAAVAEARDRQARRFAARPWRTNSHIPAGALDRDAALDDDARALWHELATNHQLTGRGAARIRRVARTLADLAGRPDVAPEDVELAAAMREEVLT